jgi:hypothetical protein
MKADVKPDSREKEAREWAIDFFRKVAGQLKRDVSKRSFDQQFASSLVELYGLPESGFDDQLALYIEATREEPRASVVLCEFAASLMERGDHLPSQLQRFVVEFLRNPRTGTKRKRGPDTFALVHRNFLISFAIFKIAKEWGLSPTRNDATERPSAVSTVRDAMERGGGIPLTEKAVNDIWGSSLWCLVISPPDLRDLRLMSARADPREKLSGRDLRDFHRLTALNARYEKAVYSLTGIRSVRKTRVRKITGN